MGSLSSKRNKNLVYYICDESYKDVLQLNLKHLYQNNDTVDTLCITPNNFSFQEHEIGTTYVAHTDVFDYRYTSKFIINKWSLAHNYENFLYLDVDAVPVRPLNDIFNCIEQQKYIIHGVREKNSLQRSDLYHKFSNTVYPEHIHAYNAGTFGFNKGCLNYFNVLLEYINSVKQHASLDQPIFNEFFVTLNLIYPTLSNFVHLYNDDCYKDINKISTKEASVIHFLGNAYSGKNVHALEYVLNNV